MRIVDTTNMSNLERYQSYLDRKKSYAIVRCFGQLSDTNKMPVSCKNTENGKAMEKEHIQKLKMWGEF